MSRISVGLKKLGRKIRSIFTRKAKTPKAPSDPSTMSNREYFKHFRPKARPSREMLINKESELGAHLFGQIPEGHRREFFQSHDNIWIWFESWKDEKGYHDQTVRYEVRPDGVFKKIATGKYSKLENDELQNFRCATHLYLNVIKQRIYN